MWIMDNQLARRNINDFTRNYLIGRRYLEEKKESAGRPEGSNKLSQNGTISVRTDKKIGDQLGIGRNTVNRAAKFSEAVDTITANTGISRAAILTKKFHCHQDNILDLAALEKDMQIKVIAKATDSGLDIESSTRAVETAERERKAALRKQLEDQARIEREEKLKIESERLKQEREEKARQAKEKLEKERSRKRKK